MESPALSLNYRADRCLPGLARKHNACMPPEQARRWQHGHLLSRDLVHYELPQPLIRAARRTAVGFPRRARGD
jgi:hypothetical protein